MCSKTIALVTPKNIHEAGAMAQQFKALPALAEFPAPRSNGNFKSRGYDALSGLCGHTHTTHTHSHDTPPKQKPKNKSKKDLWSQITIIDNNNKEKIQNIVKIT